MRTSPTQRTLALLRSQGWRHVQVVEKFNRFAGVRQDLFGIIDILAIAPGHILGVQATSRDHVSHRLEKILESPAAPDWLDAGGMLVIHGWSKKGPRGKRKLWTVYERVITKSDFATEES